MNTEDPIGLLLATISAAAVTGICLSEGSVVFGILGGFSLALFLFGSFECLRARYER